MPSLTNYIDLDREFILLSEQSVAQADIEARIPWDYFSLPKWPDIINQYRVVLLSSAGTGKTWEIAHQCQKLHEDGKQAFFIRLEYLASNFSQVIFENNGGDLDSFNEAVESQEEMWIFLDSIDEARLNSPLDFDKALRTLHPYIKNNLQNTHIIMTSRIGAWRPQDDASRVQELFPYKKPKEEGNNASASEDAGVELAYYTLRNLTPEQMRRYVETKGIKDAEKLISEIEHNDLQGLAGRPKDLDDIIAFWRKEGQLGKRLEVVEENIKRKLKEDDLNRAGKLAKAPEDFKTAAMKLAATVILTHQPKILVPDKTESQDGFAMTDALSYWNQKDYSDLLEKPIFEPETYGFVRFDHRDSRDFLAAKWFYKLLEKGATQRIEALFFKDKYGIEVVTPSLRPLLPWLALWHAGIRGRLLCDWPEILLEGGDPASLPLEEREKLLERYCAKYFEASEAYPPFDLATLKRLISKDLSDVIRSIHEKYGTHSGIENFALHAIKAGGLTELADIVVNATKKADKHPYLVIEAISAVGDDDQIKSAIETIASSPAIADRRVLAHFIRVFARQHLSWERVMELVECAGSTDQPHFDEVSQAMQVYMRDCSLEDVYSVVCRINGNLKKEPFIVRSYFQVSKDNAWMLNFGIPACEYLVEERSPLALSEPTLNILSLFSMAQSHGIHASGTKLSKIVPVWRELNAALFWRSIETARQQNVLDGGGRVTCWWRARFCNHQWDFDKNNIEEVLCWISEKECQDDKMVALTLAFDLYCTADCPSEVLVQLQEAVKGNAELSDLLEKRLNPPPVRDDEEQRKYLQREKEHEERMKQEREDTAAYHAGWHEYLPKNIDEINDLKRPSKNCIWRSQAYLFDRMRKYNDQENRRSKTNWRSLEEEFGQEIAEAMRDGLMSIWRRLEPPQLASENGKQLDFYLESHSMGLSGLEIESHENKDWLAKLTYDEARCAARYLFCELNGLPSWFKGFADKYPDITFSIISREAEWELFEVRAGQAPSYIFHDLNWHAPWYSEKLGPHILKLLRSKEPIFSQSLASGLDIILRCEGISNEDVAALCSNKLVVNTVPEEHLHLWYVAWVSVDAQPAIKHLSETLKGLSLEKATALAINFINVLMGLRIVERIDVRKNRVSAQHLLSLYNLMCKYIQRDEDIHRPKNVVYTPNPRDDAQCARDQIIQMLCDIPGPETFNALKELEESASNEIAKINLANYARKRAEADADTPWQVSRVNEFSSDLECTPSTPQELFDIAVDRLLDLKHEYEDGDYSPAGIINKTTDETEIRNYLSRELNNLSRGRYTISQEDEMPNKQRTDIRFTNPKVPSMVPVELKIADKWSGKKLLEKLRTQLGLDYLRDEKNKNGIFLLVYQGEKLKWQISNGGRVGFEELVKSLQEASRAMLKNDADIKAVGIESIEVIGIDLSKRSQIKQK